MLLLSGGLFGGGLLGSGSGSLSFDCGNAVGSGIDLGYGFFNELLNGLGSVGVLGVGIVVAGCKRQRDESCNCNHHDVFFHFFFIFMVR